MTLHHERGTTIAEEVGFWILPEEKGGWTAAKAEAEKNGVVFAVENEDDDRPGLSATIRAALAAIERGVFAARS